MKISYSFTADCHAINAQGELRYRTASEVPFEGEFDFQEINPAELNRLGQQGVVEWLEACLSDNLDDAFWDCFGHAVRRRYPYIGDAFCTHYTVEETA